MSFDKKTIILMGEAQVHYLNQIIAANYKRQAEAGKPLAITLTESKRSLEANALMWVYLTAWAEQVKWQVNGRSQHLEPGDWKDLLTAAFMHETGRIAPGLEGGMVLLGCRTRDFTGRQMADFLTFIQAASASHNPPVKIDRAIEPDLEGRVA